MKVEAEEEAPNSKPTSLSTSNTTNNFIAGCISGFVACVVGHPFDTIKLQQQTSHKSISIRESYKKLIMNMEGRKALWRGIGPALTVQILICGFLFGTQASIVDAVSSFFQSNATTTTTTTTTATNGGSVNATFNAKEESYDELESTLIDSSYRLQQAMSISTVTCATISGFFTGGLLAPIVCPLEGFKCRAQVAMTTPSSSSSSSPSIFHSIKRLYSGLTPSVLRCSIGNAAFFGVYALSQSADVNPGIGGALAGAFFWIAGMPFDVLKSRMQTYSAINSNTQAKLPTLTQTFTQIRKEVGMRGFYAGLPVTLMRAVPMNAAVFVTYDLVMRKLC